MITLAIVLLTLLLLPAIWKFVARKPVVKIVRNVHNGELYVLTPKSVELELPAPSKPIENPESAQPMEHQSHVSAVVEHLRQVKPDGPPSVVRGHQRSVPQAHRFTEADVERMRSLRDQGVQLREIGRIFNCSHSAVLRRIGTLKETKK